MKHPMVRMAAQLQWGIFENHWREQFRDWQSDGKFGKTSSWIADAQAHGVLSDERLMDVWMANPYHQYFFSKMRLQHQAIRSADIVLGLVDHEQFRRLSPEFLNEKMVIDTKGMWR